MEELTEGPGRPAKPLSPRWPGKPTIPRDPPRPWGPEGPSTPYRVRRENHLHMTGFREHRSSSYVRKNNHSSTKSGCWGTNSNSQVVHPLRPLPSLLVCQQVHAGQGLPVFLGSRCHHEPPLVRLCQKNQRDQQSQGYPVIGRQRISVSKSRKTQTQIISHWLSSEYVSSLNMLLIKYSH